MWRPSLHGYKCRADESVQVRPENKFRILFGTPHFTFRCTVRFWHETCGPSRHPSDPSTNCVARGRRSIKNGKHTKRGHSATRKSSQMVSMCCMVFFSSGILIQHELSSRSSLTIELSSRSSLTLRMLKQFGVLQNCAFSVFESADVVKLFFGSAPHTSGRLTDRCTSPDFLSIRPSTAPVTSLGFQSKVFELVMVCHGERSDHKMKTDQSKLRQNNVSRTHVGDVSVRKCNESETRHDRQPKRCDEIMGLNSAQQQTRPTTVCDCSDTGNHASLPWDTLTGNINMDGSGVANGCNLHTT